MPAWLAPPLPPLPAAQAKMTPKAFIHKIHEICRSDLQHIVLPEVRGPRRERSMNRVDVVPVAAHRLSLPCTCLAHHRWPHPGQRHVQAECAAASVGVTST